MTKKASYNLQFSRPFVIDIIPGRQLAVIKSRKRFPSISMPSFLFVRAAAFTDLIPNKYDPRLRDPIAGVPVGQQIQARKQPQIPWLRLIAFQRCCALKKTRVTDSL